MGILFANNAATTLAAGIAAGDVSASLSDTGAFPVPAAGEYFYATLTDASESVHEIVKVSGVAGGSATITRAQDGTTALSWPSGSKFEMRMCRAAVQDLAQGQGAAVGNWTAYTPTTTGLSSLGTGFQYWRYRREGDSVRISGHVCVGSGGSINASVSFSLPSGLSIDQSKSAGTQPVYAGRMVVYDNAGTGWGIPFSLRTKDSNSATSFEIAGRTDNGTNGLVGPSFPITWGNGDQFWVELLVPVAQWSSVVNLAQDFAEYAFNTSTSVTSDTTSFGNGTSGCSFTAMAPTGLNAVEKRVRFLNAIKPTDLLILELYSNGSWTDFTQSGLGRTLNDVASAAYGAVISPVAGTPTDLSVFFYSGPHPSASWSSYSALKWRVRKVSNGNFAESGTDTCSTTETLTGKTWIDGKPIFRKVVSLGALPNNATKSVAHGVVGASLFTDLRGCATNGTVSVPLPHATPSGIAYGVAVSVNGSNIDIVTGSDRTTWTGHIVLEYVK